MIVRLLQGVIHSNIIYNEEMSYWIKIIIFIYILIGQLRSQEIHLSEYSQDGSVFNCTSGQHTVHTVTFKCEVDFSPHTINKTIVQVKKKMKSDSDFITSETFNIPSDCVDKQNKACELIGNKSVKITIQEKFSSRLSGAIIQAVLIFPNRKVIKTSEERSFPKISDIDTNPCKLGENNVSINSSTSVLEAPSQSSKNLFFLFLLVLVVPIVCAIVYFNRKRICKVLKKEKAPTSESIEMGEHAAVNPANFLTNSQEYQNGRQKNLPDLDDLEMFLEKNDHKIHVSKDSKVSDYTKEIQQGYAFCVYKRLSGQELEQL